MGRYGGLIKRGLIQPLDQVAFHQKEKAPLKRRVMLEEKHINAKGIKVVIHEIKKAPKKVRDYCELHRHDYDEINLILSEKGKLVYRIQIEDEVYIVKSPACIYIPRRLRHSANVISGHGMFITNVFVSPYKAFR